MPLWRLETIFVIVILVSNFMFSVGVIFTNKILYASYKVPPISLASAHFAATFMGLVFYWFLGGFKIKSIQILKVLPICVAFCSFVVFTNFSLKYNSIGTYQMLKCLGDPMLIIFQSVLYKKVYSAKIKLTLAVMVCGIILNSIFDVTFNLTGILYALIAVFGSTFYFMWIGVKQEELDVSPLQLLLYQAPISSIMLTVVVFFIEPPWEDLGIINAFDKSSAIILVSMMMACGVNITVFYIIRHTSVVTYAVFSKLKTCVVILVGSGLFSQTRQKPLQIVGIALTLLGTLAYTLIKLYKPDQTQMISVENNSPSPVASPTTRTKENTFGFELKLKTDSVVKLIGSNHLDRSKTSY